MVVVVAAAMTARIALMIMLQHHQTTCAPTVKTVNATSRSIVQLARTVLIAATADRLSVQVGIGTLLTAHHAAAFLGATPQHLTSAANTWGWQAWLVLL